MQLRQLPIDCLKIDQAFVHEITDNPDDAILVEAIIALGKKLNLTLVAEGVETERQLEFLTALGCDRVQGYLFGGPLPAQDFERTVLKKAAAPGSAVTLDTEERLPDNVRSLNPGRRTHRGQRN
jgi:EAL domain-containing protein (putative c-di-GMP-specific phosphodiesterase class I)